MGHGYRSCNTTVPCEPNAAARTWLKESREHESETLTAPNTQEALTQNGIYPVRQTQLEKWLLEDRESKGL